jgi:hypothetical protein
MFLPFRNACLERVARHDPTLQSECQVFSAVLASFPLLDPKLRRHLGIVAAHFGEPLGVLAADEDLERVNEREVGRERVVDNGVDDHGGAQGTAQCRSSSQRVGGALAFQ